MHIECNLCVQMKTDWDADELREVRTAGIETEKLNNREIESLLLSVRKHELSALILFVHLSICI